MTRIELTPTTLIVHVIGLDKLWSLKSQLEIPLAHVTGCEADPATAGKGFAAVWKGLRLPGTEIPGVIAAGSFLHHGEWVFWDVHHPEKAIVIHLADERYARLVV